jgi:uncharacterized YigZ family protein
MDIPGRHRQHISRCCYPCSHEATAIPAEYRIPGIAHRVEDVIERSRFITTVAHAPDAEEARAFIDEMRREFPDANHNCWAFVAGPPGSTASVGMSDAGEPHGTAGRPMLDVLIHSDIGEVVAVVTRYFGGTKLGKGGLVRAYGGCVQHALESLPTVLRIERVALALTVAYSDIDAARKAIADNDAEITAEAYATDVSYTVNVMKRSVDAFLKAIADATSGRARIGPVP